MQHRTRSCLLEVAGYFLRLGATGFGGPVALCDLMARDLAERRGWFDKSQMREMIAVCQTMPGPLAVQVGIFAGHIRCGAWGGWIAGWALILPASAMVTALAAAYVHLHGLQWLSAVVYGVNPAVIALILHSWWRLTRLGMEDRFQYAVAAMAMAVTFVLPGILAALFVGAGLLGVGWYAWRSRRHGASPPLFELASPLLIATLAGYFLVTGMFTFGGGLAIVPLLERGLVEQGHWLSQSDFLAAVAVGMVTPGPVMTAATFAGYLVGGVWGAVICTIAIYLPSFALVLFAAPPLLRHRHGAFVQGFVKGAYAAAVGAILAAAILLARHAIGDWVTACIAAASLGALIRLKLDNSFVVALSAIVGWSAYQWLQPTWVLSR